jgi:hypothetical protein
MVLGGLEKKTTTIGDVISSRLSLWKDGSCGTACTPIWPGPAHRWPRSRRMLRLRVSSPMPQPSSSPASMPCRLLLSADLLLLYPPAAARLPVPIRAFHGAIGVDSRRAPNARVSSWCMASGAGDPRVLTQFNLEILRLRMDWG